METNQETVDTLLERIKAGDKEALDDCEELDLDAFPHKRNKCELDIRIVKTDGYYEVKSKAKIIVELYRMRRCKFKWYNKKANMKARIGWHYGDNFEGLMNHISDCWNLPQTSEYTKKHIKALLVFLIPYDTKSVLQAYKDLGFGTKMFWVRALNHYYTARRADDFDGFESENICYVLHISCSYSDIFRIGESEESFASRLAKHMGNSNFTDITVVDVISTEQPRKLEKAIRDKYKNNKLKRADWPKIHKGENELYEFDSSDDLDSLFMFAENLATDELNTSAHLKIAIETLEEKDRKINGLESIVKHGDTYADNMAICEDKLRDISEKMNHAILSYDIKKFRTEQCRLNKIVEHMASLRISRCQPEP